MKNATRKTRISAISTILTQSPNKLYSLSFFSEMFGSSKSTLSEDVAIIKESFDTYKLGKIEVVMGAAGGVRFLPDTSEKEREMILGEIAQRLQNPNRVLPGGFIYTADILMDPMYVDKMALILWNGFRKSNPDFIITVEAKGIPLAMSVARLFQKPLIVARRESKLTEGSVVTINYLSGVSGRMQKMSISKRSVREGQKALIIDDFIAGGGTIRAVCEIMKEFSITVVGSGAAISTRVPEKKKIDHYKSIFVLEKVDEEKKTISISVNC